MRVYEQLFIVRPDATPEEIAPLTEQLKSIITAQAGTLDKQENWGVRRLAYKLKKHSEGQYILLVFTAQASTVHELERRLRVNDLVIKFITVRIDEKLKRIEKRKKAREKRAARKPVAPAPAPSAAPMFPTSEHPAGPMPGAPSPAAPAPAAPAAETPVAAAPPPVPAHVEPTPEPAPAPAE
jgi:small subunit ribosomal protein S6